MTAHEEWDVEEAQEKRASRADRAVVMFCVGLCVVAAVAFAVWLLFRGEG